MSVICATVAASEMITLLKSSRITTLVASAVPASTFAAVSDTFSPPIVNCAALAVSIVTACATVALPAVNVMPLVTSALAAAVSVVKLAAVSATARLASATAVAPYFATSD